MNSYSVIVKYLKTLGYNPNTEYYGYIRLWKEWYENEVKKFHKYHDHNGEERSMKKLGMAKRGCEDWSSILYTERDNVVCQNEINQKYIDKQLKDLKFNDVLSDNIEKAFWSGTIGTILRINNAQVENKKIIATDKTKIKLVTVEAEQIIPLKVEDGEIVNVAFVSETMIESNFAYYIELHELEEDGYHIKNVFINEQGEEINNTKIVKEYITGSEIPLFSLLMPRIVNNIEDNNGLGISVYANAIDELEFTDTVFNNFYMDYHLGGKKVFYNKKLIRTVTRTIVDEETGETFTEEIPIYPDDITKQQFQVIGDEMDNINETPAITEHNPDLRETDNENGINMALNLYSFKIGLGKGYYKFENGTVVTATEALINNRDLTGNAKKHRNAVNEYAIGIVKAILLLGRLLFGENVTEEDEIALIDKDGFLQSEEDLKQQYLNEISAGIRQNWEYRVKFFGESEEEAKAKLQDSNLDITIEDEGN